MIKILEKAKKKVDDAEIFYVKGKELPVIFKSNNFYTAEKKNFEGLGIRVINNGKLGFSNTTKIEACGDILDYAKDSSKFGEKAKFVFPKKLRVKPVKTHFDSVNKLKTGEIKKHCSYIIKEILKKEPEAKVDVEHVRYKRTIRLLNSKGLNTSYNKTQVILFVQIFLLINNSFTWLYKTKQSLKKVLISKEEIRKLLKIAELARKEVSIEGGKMSVIFMPSVMSIFLRSLQMGTNGKLIQKGSSPLKTKMNRKILDKKITIYDDPTLKDGIATRPFDGEGITSKRIPIFKNGVLKNFLFDLQTAGLLRKESTGSAVRNYDELPRPGTSNMVVSPGKWSVADMINDTKNGIIVHDVLGGGQSNLLAGDFSCNVSLGFRIRNGKIIGRVKDTMIAGNVYHAMKNIEGIGKKVEGIRNYYTPAFYFKSLNVVGK
jgi:PmbA protein